METNNAVILGSEPSFVENMKLINASKHQPDHGDWHDPIINPQVRGWYNSASEFNKKSSIKGWNPYGSLKYEHEDHKASDGTTKYEYGRPQRGGNSHSGVDLYAPVGTPIYACVDGKITYHKMFGKKAGYLTQLRGTYKGKTYTFQYLHLMEIESDKFRFYNNYKNDPKIVNDGWKNYSELKSPLIDPIVNESYNVSYDGSGLKIDNNIVDIDLIVSTINDKFEADDYVDVKKGQIIGYTGSTGNSYQGKKRNHLHFGIRDANGHRISPYELFDQYINLDESGVETSNKQDGITPSGKW